MRGDGGRFTTLPPSRLVVPGRLSEHSCSFDHRASQPRLCGRGAGVTAQSSLCPASSNAGRSNTAPPAVQSKAANAKHSATMTRDRNNSRCAGVMPHDNMKNARRVSRRACVA